MSPRRVQFGHVLGRISKRIAEVKSEVVLCAGCANMKSTVFVLNRIKKVVRFDADDCLIVNRSLEGKLRTVKDSGDGLISSGWFDGSTLLLFTVRFEDVEEETITRFFPGININEGERAREGRVLLIVWGTGIEDIGNGTNDGNELVKF
ncbi:unnamed protein product [Didymodactylos carnosus]|uniref:Uncharacterized protein n=1 Tax=Didymodactylos carnosus TaxID=1234261 RepID=A0A813ZQM4_9BILA|nr:unnamed protein product [Didymodactylos carnosus]CAF0901741.1 unnamed protein product [Didymodactylos carnosus]CAF3505969.1 unnamed protein product [Didymodactylos carnosus]CAF3684105.1 unnamed protein product [Didymodactylos carnosus]